MSEGTEILSGPYKHHGTDGITRGTDMNMKEALAQLRLLTLQSVIRSMRIPEGSFLGGLNVRESNKAMTADYRGGVNSAYGYTVGDRYVRITIEVI